MKGSNDLLEELAELLAARVASKLAKALESRAQEAPRYYTRREAKRLLGLEVRAFDRAGRALGFLKPGKQLLLPAETLIPWIEAQRVGRAPPDPNAGLPFKGYARLARTVPRAVALPERSRGGAKR